MRQRRLHFSKGRRRKPFTRSASGITTSPISPGHTTKRFPGPASNGDIRLMWRRRFLGRLPRRCKCATRKYASSGSNNTSQRIPPTLEKHVDEPRGLSFSLRLCLAGGTCLGGSTSRLGPWRSIGRAVYSRNVECGSRGIGARSSGEIRSSPLWTTFVFMASTPIRVLGRR
jgi:hypothetical protein